MDGVVSPAASAENSKPFYWTNIRVTRFALDEDLELKLITQRKLDQLKRKMGAASVSKAEKTDREIIADIQDRLASREEVSEE